jgi:hypothetical protein
MTVDEARAWIRWQAMDYGSVARWAAVHGLSGQYVANVLGGQRPPSARLLEVVGLKKVVSYEPIVPLDEGKAA